MRIKYVKGDATRPEGTGNKIICHICNDMGAWGAGFVLALSARWTYPEQFYRARQNYPLGHVDVLNVEPGIYVANMIAQHNVRPDEDGNPPIRYTALIDALHVVNERAKTLGATLHMPRIGCGLAGGDWGTVETILKQVVTVDVTVYDL
jgi:O-acetyl-ADP-ribose deacetylase (regulator of RNase III)